MVISMNCSKALTVTNYNELANLVSGQKVASANATRHSANRAPARYNSTEAAESRNYHAESHQKKAFSSNVRLLQAAQEANARRA